MKQTLVCVFLAAVMATAAPGVLLAEDFDISSNAVPIPPDTGTHSEIHLWSANGTVHADQQEQSMILKNAGDKLTIGETGKGFSLKMDVIETEIDQTTMDIVAAADNNGPNGADVTVSVESMTFIQGEINLRGSASGKAALNIGVADIVSTTISVGSNSLLTVDRARQFNADLLLAGGDASFAGAVTVKKGSILASADSRVATGGGLIFNRETDSPENARIGVAGGATLTILSSLDGSSGYGTVTLGSEDNWMEYYYGFDAGAVLDIREDGTLRAGVLNLKDGAAFSSAGAQTGTVHVESLNVVNTALSPNTGKAFVDTENVNTIVEGATAIGEHAQYTVAGHGNVYKGGMTVRGVLDNDGDTAIRLGADGVRGAMVIDGGSVRGSASGPFAINGADIHIVAGGGEAALDASSGMLDFSASHIIATASSAAIDTACGITAESYTQTAGVMTVDGGGGKFTVTDNAVIGDAGAGAAVIFTTGSDSSVFQRGLRLVENGVIRASTTNAVIGLGSASLAADLELAGGAALDAGGGKLSILDNSGLGTARVEVTNLGNTILGAVEFTGFNLTIRPGGVLSASGAGASLTSATAGNIMHIEAGGTLNTADAGISVNGFDAVVIDGTYVVGGLGGAINRMTANTEVFFGSGAVIAMTSDLAKTVNVGDEIIVAAGGVEFDGVLGWTSMFGSYKYAITGSGIEIAGISNRVSGDTAADRQRARANLRAMWGGGQIGADLAGIVFGATVAGTVSNPKGGAAGEKNLGIFEAIANPTGTNIGRDTIEYVNGAHLYGITDAAMETSRAFLSDIAARARTVHSQFAAARESLGSVDALASAALNACAADRVWAGGFGLRQDAGARDGFSGYKYNSGGVILGYDRAVGHGFALGASAAYTRGDYKDQGALAHDSSIESWSAGLYGVYSARAGFFAALYGGYSYSDNTLRELRRDPSLGANAWSKADFTTGTWSLGGNAGRDFKMANNLVLTPSIGLNYIHARNSDHTSWLGGIATQRVRSAGNSGLFMPLEAAALYDHDIGDGAWLRFEAGIGYAFNFVKSGLDGSISYFDLAGPGGAVTSKIRSRDNARHSYRVGGGISYRQGAVDMGLRYDYMGKQSYDAHRLFGTVGLAF